MPDNLESGNWQKCTRTETKFTLEIGWGWGWGMQDKFKERLLCCIQDKPNKIRNNRDIEEYSQWWLLLVDYVEYGISDVDCEEQKRWLIDKKDFWAKVIILHPEHVKYFCVL